MSGEPKIISIYESDTYDVYQNQAAELAIFETVKEDEIALFLWTNERTVVIGRNQDALTECKVELLNFENGHLARRLSGGGAVYHDMGNLNFTFCAHKSYFDKKKNFEVVLRAMKSCGFDVELSGRNDLMIGGKKFSGNAYYGDGNRNYHHGTILIDTDGAAVSRYLTPSEEKLKTKGVASVEARVVNLKNLNPNFSKTNAISALKDAFINAYPISKLQIKSIAKLPSENLTKNLLYFSNRDWILGEQVCYNLRCDVRLDFGLCEVLCNIRNRTIFAVKIITDALDTARVERLEKLLLHARIGNENEANIVNENKANIVNENKANIVSNAQIEKGNKANTLSADSFNTTKCFEFENSCADKDKNEDSCGDINKILGAISEQYEL